jgi:hypothetical protein
MEGFDRLSEPCILAYDGPWWNPGGFIGWCGESVQPLKSVIYSNSRILGHGRLEWPYLTCVEFWVLQNDSWKNGVCRTEYLEGTVVAPEWIGVLRGYYRSKGEWSCMIDHGCLRQASRSFSPFPRAFAKTSLVSIFFNKDIEMSYDMLYRHKNSSYKSSLIRIYKCRGTCYIDKRNILVESWLQPSQPCYSPNSMCLSSLRWFASTIPKCTHGFVPGY